jgi:hypothetical protein
MAAMAGGRLGGRPDSTQQSDNERIPYGRCGGSSYLSLEPLVIGTIWKPSRKAGFRKYLREEMNAFAKAFATTKSHGIIWQNGLIFLGTTLRGSDAVL